MPVKICSCPQGSSSVIAGNSIVVVAMNGKKNFGGGVNSVEVAAEFHPQLFPDHPHINSLPLTFCHSSMP